MTNPPALVPLPPAGAAVMFGGSRSLAPGALPVDPVVFDLAEAGCVVSVGCAAGADAQALAAALAYGAPVRLFCVGAASGAGFWSGSAPLPLLASVVGRPGCSVTWSAGGPVAGPLAPPFRARLLRRSLAALAGCDLAVFFLARPFSPGSFAVAAAAVRQAVPVVAFCASQPAPLAGVAGCWSPAILAGFSCWRWSPAASQPALF